jgi:hypothetical protein
MDTLSKVGVTPGVTFRMTPAFPGRRSAVDARYRATSEIFNLTAPTVIFPRPLEQRCL